MQPQSLKFLSRNEYLAWSMKSITNNCRDTALKHWTEMEAKIKAGHDISTPWAMVDGQLLIGVSIKEGGYLSFESAQA